MSISNTVIIMLCILIPLVAGIWHALNVSARDRARYQASLASCMDTGKPLYKCEREINGSRFGLDIDFGLKKD
jgi:hypothetical protein